MEKLVKKSEVFEGYEYEGFAGGHRYKAFDEELRDMGMYWIFFGGYSSFTLHYKCRALMQFEPKSMTFYGGELPSSFSYPGNYTVQQKVRFAERIIKKYGIERLGELLRQDRQETLWGSQVTVLKAKEIYDCIEERFEDEV